MLLTNFFQEVKVKTENEEADKKLEDQEDEEIRELSAEERYTKLMDLLNKSKFYSKFLQVNKLDRFAGLSCQKNCRLNNVQHRK